MSGQDGLVAAVAAHLGGAAGGFALHQEQLAALGVLLLAVGQLAGQAARVERALAAGEVAGAPRRFPGPRGVDGLGDDLAHDGGVLVEVLAQLLVDELDHVAADVAVELALGLPLELRLGQLNADHGGEALADVVAGEVFLDVLEQAGLLAVGS